ncbi:hypothetical protein T4A_9050 [Trichinella pseudospiralis]|uniref:Uncharacterized protein n=1 Tax=Trichinella pseudospiralis TaxID=6337 RepID=A0A0V1DSN3_TRIPS|nr:hypothetical protein T4A_9050 [Trichinella pseudospiralis]
MLHSFIVIINTCESGGIYSVDLWSVVRSVLAMTIQGERDDGCNEETWSLVIISVVSAINNPQCEEHADFYQFHFLWTKSCRLKMLKERRCASSYQHLLKFMPILVFNTRTKSVALREMAFLSALDSVDVKAVAILFYFGFQHSVKSTLENDYQM